MASCRDQRKGETHSAPYRNIRLLAAGETSVHTPLDPQLTGLPLL